MKNQGPMLAECAHHALDAYGDTSAFAYCWTSQKLGLRVVCSYDDFHQRLWIAFRGTANAKNWVTNLKAWGRNHAGINQAAEKLMPEVFYASTQVPWHDFVVVGHSLGGALAEHGMAHFKDRYPDSPGWCCTFGAVRSRKTWEAMSYQAAYGSVTIRAVNNGDVVPRLLKLRYRHVGRRVYFDRHGDMVTTRMGWAKMAWDRLAGTDVDGVPDAVGDHDMRKYMDLASRNNKALGTI